MTRKITLLAICTLLCTAACTRNNKSNAVQIDENEQDNIAEQIDDYDIEGIDLNGIAGEIAYSFARWSEAQAANKKIESGNIIEEIASDFAKRKEGTYPGNYDDDDGTSYHSIYYEESESVSSLEKIIPVTGYYIQQQGRWLQGDGRAPEILVLSVENGKVFILEIDIINGQTIIRNKILLKYNGKTYAHNRTKLVETKSGEIRIIYLENAEDEKKYYGAGARDWDYRDPYTFAGNIKNPMPVKVSRLTGDYLRIFAGRYVFDSYKVVASENKTIGIDEVQNRAVQIEYSQEKKCLSSLYDVLSYDGNWESELIRQWWLFDFVETAEDEPFFCVYGESIGFYETRYYFYKGGIAYTYETYRPYIHDDDNYTTTRFIKYVVFFRKMI